MDKENYDLAVIGCGPAGLSAAVNARVRKKSVILLGGELCTPKLQKSPLVSNYLGLPEIRGSELREKFLEHARLLDIPIQQVKVESVSPGNGGVFSVQAGKKAYQAGAVIIATGVTVNELFKGEREFTGKGISYCATCDGPLFKDKDVAVFAGASGAVEEANYLAAFCRKVYFIAGAGQRSDVDGLKSGIEVIHDQVLAVKGNDFLSLIQLEGRELPVQGFFIYRDTYLPDRLLEGLVLEDNHIRVDHDYKTNIPGVYAAGDCTGKPYQLAKAAGEGQVAALNAVQYLDRPG
jgi:thioredoxin reductase (NADPH)